MALSNHVADDLCLPACLLSNAIDFLVAQRRRFLAEQKADFVQRGQRYHDRTRSRLRIADCVR